MVDEKPILFSYLINHKNECSSVDEHIENIEHKLIWTHLDATHDEIDAWIQQRLKSMDSYAHDALLSSEARPRIAKFDENILLILRGVNLNENADPEDMISLRVWIEGNHIYSFERRKLKAILDLKELMKNGKILTIGDFMTNCIDRLFTRMEPVLLHLDELTDEVEEQVIEDANIALREEIASIRRQAILIKRYLSPQREVIVNLRSGDFQHFSKDNKRHLTENYERIFRFIEDLDAIRERAQIIKDEIATILADRLNKNMYLLSIIAAIFLPLGFLTGLLGVNLSGIPGAENIKSFSFFCLFLFIVVALQITIFKKLKWF